MIGCLGKIAMGLAIAGGLTLGGCALVMGSCTVGLGGIAASVVDSVDTTDFVNAFTSGVARIGSLVLATPSQLDGTLTRSPDGYTGTYQEECRNTSGSCALFGGTELAEHRLTVRYNLSAGGGSAELTLQGLGDEVVVARAGDKGEKTFAFEAGSNYLCLTTRDYTGVIAIEVVETDQEG